jgi:hypothetical protein
MYCTIGELGAALQLFDLDEDGRISCNEFTVVFNRLKSQEIAAQTDKSRRIMRSRQQRSEEFQQHRISKAMEALDLRLNNVTLPPLSSHSDSATPNNISDDTKVLIVINILLIYLVLYMCFIQYRHS